MTKRSANQPSSILKGIKAIILTLLVLLFLLWLASPLIIKKLILHYLPAPWTISELVIHRPGLSEINIEQLTLANSTDIKVNFNKLIIPYRYQTLSWQIASLKLVVNDSNSNERQDNNSSQLPILASSPLPIDIKVNQADIKINDFRFNGAFSSHQTLIQLDGQLYTKQYQLPVNAQLANIGTTQPLALTVKLAEQEFQLQYDRDTGNQTPLKLSAHLNQQIIPVIKQFTKQSIPDIQLADSELIANAALHLPQQPTDIDSWLHALASAEAKFQFSEIKLPENALTVSANQWQLNWANQQLTLNQQLPSDIKLLTKNIKWQARLNNDKPLTLDWQQPKMKLVQSPNIELNGQGQYVEIQPNTLTINTDNHQVHGNVNIAAKLMPNKLVKDALTFELGEFALSGKLNVELTDQLVSTAFNQLELLSKDAIAPLPSAPELQITEMSLQTQDFTLQFNNEQPVNAELLQRLQLAGKLRFNTSLAQQPIISHCDWQWQIAISTLSCQTQPQNSSPNNAVFSQLTNTNNQKINYQIEAKELELGTWPVSAVLAIDQLTGGQADINLSGQLSLPHVKNDSWQQWLKTLAPDSRITIKQLAAVAYQQNISQAKLDYQTQANDIHQLDIAIKQLSNPSLPAIEDIKLNAMLNNDLASAQAKLNFHLFGGEHLVSIPKLKLNQAKQQLTWQTEQLDLAQLMTWLNINGLTASGKLSGTIPFELSPDALTIQQAQLAATESGKIQYLQPGDNTPFAEKNIAFQALENFQYQELTLTNGEANLPLNAEGAYRLPMRIVGHNPALYHGKSIAINPVISGTLPEKALYYLLNQKALSQGISTAKDD